MTGNAGILRQVPEWNGLAWLRHGFSTRFGGVSVVYQALHDTGTATDLNLGWTKDDCVANVIENRRRLVAAATGSDTDTTQLITLRQVHSARSLVVPESPRSADFVTPEGRALLEADGLMTTAPGSLLGIQTADCVPVFVIDTKLRVVANFHAGWRGTAARIVELGVAKMAAEFGSRPEDLAAAIGPSIGACCYSVGDEVHQAFTSQFGYGEDLFTRAPDPAGPLHLDLWQANRRQLLDSGVAPARIAVLGECTGCSGLPGPRRYFSHRCEHGLTGRMMSVIGIA
jgi:YfiH family protein